jgi:uncharacterized repeat protein (TIGR01451 family)
MTFARHVKHASLALWVLSSIGVLQSAQASGTDAGVPINNRATVNYSVGTVAQTPIESSPTGNSNPGVGVGTDTGFVVDNKIIHTVGGASGAVITAPGATDVIATFTVTNNGNNTQGYQLTATNLTGGSLFGNTDNTDVDGPTLRAYHDVNNNGVVDGGDTLGYINTLAEDATASVLVLANVPLTTANGQFANVQLAARAATAGSNGATFVTETGDTVADNPLTVDVVFADGGAVARNAIHEAADQYAIQSASLTLSKVALVVSDGFSTSNPKPIPGAIVRYTVTLTNGSTTTAAESVEFTDAIPANTVFVPGSLTLNTVTLTDADDATDTGHYEASPTPRIVVDAGNVAASGTATVTFEVTIQ